MTKTDLQLKQDVEGELDWDPKINSAQLAVGVARGVVSLLGRVDTYAEKLAAEQAVKRVSGVRAISNNLTVQLAKHHERSDADIAAAVRNALAWNVIVPEGVTATVESGCIDLAGEVIWNHQRNAAEQAVRNLIGVVNVNNSISIVPETLPEQVKQKVQAALQRQATADVRSIHIAASGGKVILTGYAASWQAIEDAANAAWAVPGVTEVSDRVKLSLESPSSS